jgi:hypothetical protein
VADLSVQGDQAKHEIATGRLIKGSTTGGQQHVSMGSVYFMYEEVFTALLGMVKK